MSRAVAGITTDANEALRLLADRAEARGSERERAQARGLRDLRRRLILLRRQAHRVCGKQQHNNQTIPVAAGKAVGTSLKVQQFCGFAPEVLCLRVVPTVGITVGMPAGSSVGIFYGRMRHHLGTTVGIAVGTIGAPISGRKEPADAPLDFRARPAKAVTADLDQPARVGTAGERSAI